MRWRELDGRRLWRRRVLAIGLTNSLTISLATALATALACGVAPLRAQGLAVAAYPVTVTVPVPEPAPRQASVAAPDDRVEITGRHYDNGVGSSDAASQGTVRAELLQSRPALRPGDVLEFVPGMVVTQHSGDGKANQYFLRGFNLDHGTDFATTVNGLPVNMPSHAHGQGYADLNFLLPELVDRIAYRKGPYFASHGDFSSAGAADVVYRTRLDAPLVALTLGERGFRRGVAAGSAELGAGLHLLAAIELQRNDGPWAVPEGLHKANGLLTLSAGTAVLGWSASLMAYKAQWTATDQIPQRLIDAGSYQGRAFGRFDTLDASNGGSTRRNSLSGEWHRQGEQGDTRVAAYVIDYRLQLFSNFSYALDRPLQGDQFSQLDQRQVAGGSISHGFEHGLAGLPARSELGLQWRQDRIRLGLADTQARQLISATREDKVASAMLGLRGQTGVELLPWLRAVVGLRLDQARFRVDSLLQPVNSGASHGQRLSPKLALVLGPWAKTELFFNAGKGMHSNDARGTTAVEDARSGEPLGKVPALVASRGFELGARSEWIPGLQSSLALWRLDFDS